MLENSLTKLKKKISAWRWLRSRWVYAVLLPLWLMTSLGLAILTSWISLYVFAFMGVTFESANDAVFNATFAAVIYVLTIMFAIGLPRLLQKYITWKDIGLTGLPSWADIGLAPVGFIIYFLASSLLVYLASITIPGFDIAQVQETGFARLAQNYEYILAFTTLIVVAPVAEEILFRGFLYGKLRRHVPIWVAMVITSALFGLIHGQWNVAIDVFALSIVLCSLREITGSIWAGILLHMLKNSVAFFIIFISPVL